MKFVMVNWLVGHLIDLMANKISCNSNRYIRGRILSLSSPIIAGIII